MSKISQLAASIKNTSQQEAQNIEQGLRSDFEQTRQNISDYLNQEASTIKADIRNQLKQSVAHAVAESEAATSQAAQQIAQQINRLQQRINSQISDQEAQILQQLITQLQQSLAELQAQADKMSKEVDWFERKLDQAIDNCKQRLSNATNQFRGMEQEAKAQEWNINHMTKMIRDAQNNHYQSFQAIAQKFEQTDEQAGHLMRKLADHTESTAKHMQQRIDQTQQHMKAQLAVIDKTADKLQESITRKLFAKTYHPLAMIAWITLLLLVTTFTSCSVYMNRKTSNDLDTQIAQKQAILADINRPINAAHASQLANLVTIEQTMNGILIKSRHPKSTQVINKSGLTASQNQKALLIAR